MQIAHGQFALKPPTFLLNGNLTKSGNLHPYLPNTCILTYRILASLIAENLHCYLPFTGGSTKLICEAKGNRTLHVFDTFEGLPDLSSEDNKNRFYMGQYSSSFEDVKNYLKKYQNIYFYKGLFPFSAEPVKNNKFSFVHLDVDLYEATLASLKFFYQRMNKGGIIISHDYIEVPGVRKAFDEFFKDKPEPIIELSGTQCLISKL